MGPRAHSFPGEKTDWGEIPACYTGIHLYELLSPYLCFISFFYLNWCVQGYDASISLGYIMRTTHLCVLIYIRIKGEVGTIKHV